MVSRGVMHAPIPSHPIPSHPTLMNAIISSQVLQKLKYMTSMRPRTLNVAPNHVMGGGGCSCSEEWATV
jgi:hypothetical protein